MAGRWNIERAITESPPGLHPLAGCDLRTLLDHLRQNDEYSVRTRAQRLRSISAVIFRQPFTLSERLFFGRKVANYELPHPPIFLVGHWRSGTTHLHNLMSCGTNFSTIDFGQTAMPHSLLNPTRVIGRAIVSSVMPKDRGMDQVKVAIDEPQEEEMAIGNLNPICYYNVFYYPHQMKEHFDRSIFLEATSEAEKDRFKQSYSTLLRKLSIAGGDKQLLLKNPASTARLNLLNEVFPGSRFVHIMRNPFEVFASMLHHYPRLFNAFSWHDFSDIDLEEMVFYKYGRLMKGYLEQRKELGDRIIETSYEKVVENPVEEIGKIYDGHQLEGKKSSLEKVATYAKARSGYKRNRYQLTRHQIERIQSEWGFSLEEWGYEQPDSIEVVD